GFGHRAHEALNLQNVQATRARRINVCGRCAFSVPVAIAPPDSLVAPRAERPPRILGAWAVPGEDDGGDVGTHPGMVECPVQFIDGVGAERVAYLRTVKGDSHHGLITWRAADALDSTVVGDVGEIEPVNHPPLGGLENFRNLFRQSTHAPTLWCACVYGV